jgi:type I restriction enzyme S subunit
MKYGLSDTQLDEIVALIGSYPEIEEAILFGSRAIGSYKEASDVDIALKGETVTAALAAKLKFDFEEDTYLPFFFDFVAYPTITSESLREHIEQKGVPIYRAGWQECLLEDVAYFQRGHDLPKLDMLLGDVPVAGSNGIIGYHNLATTKGPGITIGRSGNIGTPKFYKNNFWAHNTVLFVKDFKGNDEKFVFYFLNTLDFQGFNAGSAVPTLNRNHIHEIPVKIPPLPEQRAIASVLSSLDDKIDLLHRQNKTLETMAETLFRQWFVGDADDGDTGQISDLVDFNPNRKLPKGSVAPYLEMANVNTTVFHPENWYMRAFTSGMKFMNGDTLLARITPCLENGKSVFVTFLDANQVGWGSTEFIVMRSKENLHPFFTYALVRNRGFRDYAEGCLEGSSGRQRVDVGHLSKFEINIPDGNVVTLFNNAMDSIASKLHSNFIQIRTLSNIRDTLLPKLMSGEVRVAV